MFVILFGNDDRNFSIDKLFGDYDIFLLLRKRYSHKVTRYAITNNDTNFLVIVVIYENDNKNGIFCKPLVFKITGSWQISDPSLNEISQDYHLD